MGPKEPAKSYVDSAARADAEGRRLKRWQASDLVGDEREAIVEHAGQDYRLRITANNKLILTK